MKTPEELAQNILNENWPHFDCCGGDYCEEPLSGKENMKLAVHKVADLIRAERQSSEAEQAVIEAASRVKKYFERREEHFRNGDHGLIKETRKEVVTDDAEYARAFGDMLASLNRLDSLRGGS